MILKSLSVIVFSFLISSPSLGSSEPSIEFRAKQGGFFHLVALTNILGANYSADIATELLWRTGSNFSLGLRYDLFDENNSRPSIIEGQIREKGYWDDFSARSNSQFFGPVLEYEYPIVSWLRPYVSTGYRYGYEKDSLTRVYRNSQNKECSIARRSRTKHANTRAVAGLGLFIADRVTIRIAYGVENRRQVSGNVIYESSGSGCDDFTRFDATNSARKGNHQQVDFDLGLLL